MSDTDADTDHEHDVDGDSEEIDQEAAERMMADFNNSFNMLFGCLNGFLDAPETIETGFPGPEAKALGSARHAAEQIEEDGVYDVEFEPIGSVVSPVSDDPHYRYRFRITSSSDE